MSEETPASQQVDVVACMLSHASLETVLAASKVRTPSFLTLPLWWAGTVMNAVCEVLNLAALGYAPATLVTPLGCLTVVFNAIASALVLHEPFLHRDLWGILLIFFGVHNTRDSLPP